MGSAATVLDQEIFPHSVPLLKWQQVRPCLENLDDFLKRYLPHFYRIEQRGHARTLIEGLLSDLPRKTLEPIALDHHQQRRPVQHFVGAGPWQEAPILSELHGHVVEAFGDPKGVLVIDPSSFPKKGIESVGVNRQWCGRLGKVDNCQLGVFLAYVTPQGGTLVDHQLYLPRCWTRSPKRRRKAHVPDSVRYRSTLQIADELLQRDGSRFPHAWVVADDEFGRPAWFRHRLGDRGERYLLEVPGNTRIRDLETPAPKRRGRGGRPPRLPFTPMRQWAQGQPASRWTRFDVRDGEKGPLQLEALRLRVQTQYRKRLGREETMLMTRTLGSSPEYKCWLAPANVPASFQEMVWVSSLRHRVEEFLQWGKGQAGLAHYEVRSWIGWHHHMTLSLLAQFYLTLEHQRLGKKISRPDDPPGGTGDRRATA